MFESLKKKFTGTIGKISDKVTAEEELEAASEETEVVKSTEKSESPKSVEKSDTKPVDDRSSETESKVEDEKKIRNVGISSWKTQ